MTLLSLAIATAVALALSAFFIGRQSGSVTALKARAADLEARLAHAEAAAQTHLSAFIEGLKGKAQAVEADVKVDVARVEALLTQGLDYRVAAPQLSSVTLAAPAAAPAPTTNAAPAVQNAAGAQQ